MDISKPSLRINSLRYLSDFRDNVVSRTSAGRKFIQFYTENEAWGSRIIVIVFIVVISSILAIAMNTRLLKLPARLGATAGDNLHSHSSKN
jgi:hypothetical protein